MTAISKETMIFLMIVLRSANSVFLWGFMYYAVFLYLIRNRHYKTPNQRQAERQMTYISSWMLMLWLLTTLTALYVDMF